jgi:Flp pilus assembly protein TadG
MAYPKASRNPARGATIIEVALATVVLFMFALAVIDLARVQIARSRLQYAVSQSTRFAARGQTLADPNEPNKQMSRSDSIVYRVKRLSNLRNLASSDIVLKSTNAAGETFNGAGGAGDLVTLQAAYRVNIVAPFLSAAFEDGQHVFTCAATYRNEEFSQ